jgi:arylsulfatase A-like enzyme
VTVAAGTVLAGTGAASRVAAAGTAGKRPPNILLLYSDQHNARVLGSAGHPDVKTPSLDRLAAEGMRFDRAYCQDAICSPSRASLMTGLYPRSTGILFNGDDLVAGTRIEPLPLHLQRHGYTTGAFGKRHLAFNKRTDAGWDVTGTSLNPRWEPSDESYWQWVRENGQWDAFQEDWNAENGARYTPSRCTELCCHVSRLTPDATMEAWTARKAIDFIRESAKGDKPFFCWTSFYRPHQPYTPQPHYYDLYDLEKLHLPASLHEPLDHLPPKLQGFRSGVRNPWCLGRAAKDESIFRRFLACYYGCLTEIDRHIGTIMEALKETGQADNTIVLYTADHGDFATNHGLVEKFPWGHNVYEETLRVPLIIHWPGHVREGDVRQDLVEQVDLYPTLMDLIGIEPPKKYALPGRPLTPTLTRGQKHDRRYAICENPYMLTVVGQRMKLGAWIERQKGDFPDMLFDRVNDPLEVENVIGRAETKAAEKELRDEMAAWMERTANVCGKPLRPYRMPG